MPRRYLFIMFILIIGLFITGCAVKLRPLTVNEIETRAQKDLEIMFSDQELVSGPITLYEAMARAIKYNLDYRLKLMEEALANRQLDVAKYDLLPELTSAAGYRHRNNFRGASSQSLLTGQQSLEASTSEQRDIVTVDYLQMTWNVLDFGVSYYRAKQQADRALISEEQRRKVIQNIIQDVRYAFWRAVGSERLKKEMIQLLERTESALEASRKIAGQRLKAPRESLIYQRALLENIRLLWELIERLDRAKKELAALMNLNPGVEFTLAEPDWKSLETPSFSVPVEDLERMAIVQRPELREEDYRARISAHEVRSAILGMLPGLELNFNYSYDSNDFLFNSVWNTVGSRISWNVFSVFSGPAAIRSAETLKEVDHMRRQAVSMAVLTQVHLALQRYGLIKNQYIISRDLDEVNGSIHEQVAAAEIAGREGQLAVIRSATSALVAVMQHHEAYAELQNAAGRIYHSIGADLMPEKVESLDVGTLAKALEASFEQWDKRLIPRESPELKEDIPKSGKLGPVEFEGDQVSIGVGTGVTS